MESKYLLIGIASVAVIITFICVMVWMLWRDEPTIEDYESDQYTED